MACAPSSGCPDAVAAAPALREAPDSHTAEPPAMTPNANALSVTADIDVRAATCDTNGRASDRVDATRVFHATIRTVEVRHAGRRHAGRRNAGRRNARRRDSRKRNLGTRQLGRCQVGTRGSEVRSLDIGNGRVGRCHRGSCNRRNSDLGKCHAGTRQAGTRHLRRAGSRHLGTRNLRTADTTNPHDAAANITARRDAAKRMANRRTNNASVGATTRRRAGRTARAGGSGTGGWLSERKFGFSISDWPLWVSEGKSPSGSSGESVLSEAKSVSGGSGIRGEARDDRTSCAFALVPHALKKSYVFKRETSGKAA